MNDFDAEALFAAMDSQRTIRGLSWRQVAAEIRDQSRELNARRNDHPISPSTLTGIARRRDTSCQHALSILRWLDCAPERFLRLPPAADRVAALPAVGPDRRLRWNLKAMHAALDARRRELDVTWKALASGIGCAASQLTGLKTARYATSMRLAMRITRWLGVPAATFVYAARW